MQTPKGCLLAGRGRQGLARAAPSLSPHTGEAKAQPDAALGGSVPRRPALPRTHHQLLSRLQIGAV